MGVYCFTELGSVWVTAALWSLHRVKWTLLMRASPPLFKDLTCDLLPWVLLEKPLILNYWYFLPCRRTSVLSAASLFLTLLSGREVIVGLVWVFLQRTTCLSYSILWGFLLAESRSSDLLPTRRGSEDKALPHWEMPGSSQHDCVWVGHLCNPTIHC